jgi:hypothetical protein
MDNLDFDAYDDLEVILFTFSGYRVGSVLTDEEASM